MSTKLEDLSVSDYEEEDYREEYNPIFEETDTNFENFEEEKQEEKQEEDLQKKIYTFFYEKIKDPILVTFLMLLFTNKLVLRLLNSMSFLQIVEANLGLNVLLSILAGIVFFIIREFV
jgi:hypothetical protein